jgi:hypothetical protein
MPARDSSPDVIALDEGVTWRLSPRSERAREWLLANVEAKRGGSGSAVVTATSRCGC